MRLEEFTIPTLNRFAADWFEKYRFCMMQFFTFTKTIEMTKLTDWEFFNNWLTIMTHAFNNEANGLAC